MSITTLYWERNPDDQPQQGGLFMNDFTPTLKQDLEYRSMADMGT